MEVVYTKNADEMIRLVEREQLTDRSLWTLVVKQFEGTPDDADLGWRGEYWGKLMRGACMTWQYTKDETLYQILQESVTALLDTQDEEGRISTYSKEAEFQGWDMWCRKYVLLGLLHFEEICRDEKQKEQILEAAGKHLDYIIDHIGREEGKKSITKTSDHWLGINSSSILEPVVRLYMKKPDRRYLEFADYIVENGGAQGFDIFQAAYENRLYPYQYPVVKAYELMSCFEGLLVYAQVTGSEKWKQAVIRFTDRLLESEATVVGGSGCHHELFNHSSLMQTGTKYDGLMLETCVTVTWMKLMFRVYEMTGDLRYLEEVERSAFNALYGAVNTEGSTCGPETTYDETIYRDVYAHATAQKGRGQIFDSYSPLRSGIRGRAIGGFKSMEQETQYCGCCIAIGAAGTALVPMAAARERENGIEIGIYLPGTIHAVLESVPVELITQTDYPIDGEIAITVNPQTEKEFALSLRIPSFTESARVTVNGIPQGMVPGDVQAGTFLCLKRCWKAGDEIRLSLNWSPRLLYGMENPDDPDSSRHAAILYGALTLARDKRLGEEGTLVRLKKGAFTAEKIPAPIPCQCCFEIKTEQSVFRMVDYASAGKTWRRDSEMEVWMKTEEDGGRTNG